MLKHYTTNCALVTLLILVGCGPLVETGVTSPTTTTTTETATTTTVVTSETAETAATATTTETGEEAPVDADKDGYTSDVDCDDTDGTINPGAKEICDGIDNDCTGAADEEWDEDGDGTAGCAGDCDDTNPYLSPNIPEICDGVDNNCDDVIDEGFDLDGDGQETCRGDCDDTNPDVYLGAEELCDGVDTDCDPLTVDDADLDADGFSLCDGDCDDLSADALPGGEEVCDGLDNDCNGSVDELPDCFGCSDIGGYSYCTADSNWSTAEAACVAFGGHLVSMNSPSINTSVSNTAWSIWGTSWWIGYSDTATEGTFVWSDGSPSGYTSWYGGEPNDYGTGEDCASTNYGDVGMWNDYTCGAALPFVCEYAP
jgi:hypothetical protein